MVIYGRTLNSELSSGTYKLNFLMTGTIVDKFMITVDLIFSQVIVIKGPFVNYVMLQVREGSKKV